MTKMTVRDYATAREIGESGVRNAISRGHRLPGVTKLEKFGKAHVLHVDKRKLKKFLEVSKKTLS